MSGVLSSARRYLINLRMQSLPQNANIFTPSRFIHSDEEKSKNKETIFSIAASELKNTGKKANDGLNKAGSEIEKVYDDMAEGLLKIEPAFRKMGEDIQSHTDTISEQAKQINAQKLARESDLQQHKKDLDKFKIELEARKSEFKNFQFGFYAFSAAYIAGAAIGSYILFRAKQGLNEAQKEFHEAHEEIHALLDKMKAIRMEIENLQKEIKTITHEDTLQKIMDLEKKVLKARAEYDALDSRAELLDQFIKNQENAKGQHSIDGIRGEFARTRQEILLLVEQAKRDISEERNRAIQTVEKANPSSFKQHLLNEIDKEKSRLQVKWNASFSSYGWVSSIGLSRGSSHQEKMCALEMLRTEITDSKDTEFHCSDSTKKLLTKAYEYWPEQEDTKFKKDFIDVHLKDCATTIQMTLKR